MNSESSQTVQRFCLMGAEELAATASSIPLSHLVPHLPRVQQYYRTQEYRDPRVFELRFLDAIAALHNRLPVGIHVSALTAEEEQLRIFGDVCRMCNELGDKTPPTLYDVMRTSGRYLTRSGITPRYTVLRAMPTAQYALLDNRENALSLSLESVTATLSPASVTTHQGEGVLLALPATSEARADAEYAAFLAANRTRDLRPLGATGESGALSTLITLSGVTLDMTAQMDEEADALPLALAPHSLLFVAPEVCVATLFESAPSLSLLGTLNKTGRIAFVFRGETLTSFDLRMLQSLRVQYATKIVIGASTPHKENAIPSLTEDDDVLLGGISTCDDGAQSTLLLATELVRRGARLDYSALSVVLEYPTTAADTHIGDAFALVLGLHRATCELVLPTSHCALVAANVERPRLSIFLAAKKGEPHPMEHPKDWQDARDHFYRD